jgi:hypothetical protein
VAAPGKDRASREARERARTYQARQALHDAEVRRRSRDNVIAGVAGGILLLALLGGQAAYFTVGPGGASASTPTPTSTGSPVPGPTDSASPAPTTGAPTPTSTP